MSLFSHNLILSKQIEEVGLTVDSPDKKKQKKEKQKKTSKQKGT